MFTVPASTYKMKGPNPKSWKVAVPPANLWFKSFEFHLMRRQYATKIGGSRWPSLPVPQDIENFHCERPPTQTRHMQSRGWWRLQLAWQLMCKTRDAHVVFVPIKGHVSSFNLILSIKESGNVWLSTVLLCSTLHFSSWRSVHTIFFRATLPPGKWLSLQYISHSGKGRWIQLYKIGCTVQHLCLYSTGWGCVEGLWLRLGTKLDARKCLKGPRNCKNKLGDWVRSFCLKNIHLSKIVFLVVFLL